MKAMTVIAFLAFLILYAFPSPVTRALQVMSFGFVLLCFFWADGLASHLKRMNLVNRIMGALPSVQAQAWENLCGRHHLSVHVYPVRFDSYPHVEGEDDHILVEAIHDIQEAVEQGKGEDEILRHLDSLRDRKLFYDSDLPFQLASA